MAPGSPPDIAANLAETLRRIDTARPDGAVPPLAPLAELDLASTIFTGAHATRAPRRARAC